MAFNSSLTTSPSCIHWEGVVPRPPDQHSLVELAAVCEHFASLLHPPTAPTAYDTLFSEPAAEGRSSAAEGRGGRLTEEAPPLPEQLHSRESTPNSSSKPLYAVAEDSHIHQL